MNNTQSTQAQAPTVACLKNVVKILQEPEANLETCIVGLETVIATLERDGKNTDYNQVRAARDFLRSAPQDLDLAVLASVLISDIGEYLENDAEARAQVKADLLELIEDAL